MLYFLRMPNEAIHVGECSDQRVNDVMKDIRDQYEPIFIKKICTIHNRESEFRKEFTHLKINDVKNQYKPSDRLIDFINTYHDPHNLFRKQEYTIGYADIEACHPPNFAAPVEVRLTQRMQSDLLIEGAHQSVSATDLIREVIDFYMKIRTSVRAGQDQDAAENIEKFNKYMLRK